LRTTAIRPVSTPRSARSRADGSDTVKRAARDLGIPVLTKPIKPASLRAFLAAQMRRAGAGA